MSSRVNEVNGENLQDPQSKILATPMETLDKMQKKREIDSLRNHYTMTSSINV